MSQRNPMNDRYQDEDRKGVSKKSAASAKPKSSAASTVHVEPTKKTAKEKKLERKQREREQAEKDKYLQVPYSTPDTPEYVKWKRIWWIGLLAAVILVGLSWVLRNVEPSWLSLAVLMLAYVAIIFAFWVDLSKIKKINRAWQEQQVELARKANKGKSKKQIKEEYEAREAEKKRIAQENAEKTLIGKMKKKRAEKKAAKAAESSEEETNEAKEDAKETK